MTSSRADTLLAWCATQGITVSADLELVEDAESGLAVHTRGRAVPPLSPLVAIPKSAVLSTRACALAPQIPHAPHGPDALLALALALHSERLRGAASRWAGYLQTLPTRASWDGVALFWGASHPRQRAPPAASPSHLQSASEGLDAPARPRPRPEHAHASDTPGGGGVAQTERERHRGAEPDAEDRDGSLARAWLRGTEAQALLSSAQTPTVAAVHAFFETVAAPLLAQAHGAGPARDVAGFVEACALVSARAFVVDAYHGLAMVPVADACVLRPFICCPLLTSLPRLNVHHRVALRLIWYDATPPHDVFRGSFSAAPTPPRKPCCVIPIGPVVRSAPGLAICVRPASSSFNHAAENHVQLEVRRPHAHWPPPSNYPMTHRPTTTSARRAARSPPAPTTTRPTTRPRRRRRTR
ncbi:hypothetical protein FA95DRAFT_1276340 [Auriscalpium vulgare]|uniref:Uncharacterized protein n=1 Tax=Auriscalpium vulgare TaxID=40419 RepID=A0ACB8RT79_9AGAM|nr:hypothetical protein FA95DRAFT_1276340 [Auriscalpium vulgare]